MSIRSGKNPTLPRQVPRMPSLGDPYYRLINHLCHDLRNRLPADGVCGWAHPQPPGTAVSGLSINHTIDAETHRRAAMSLIEAPPFTSQPLHETHLEPTALHGQTAADGWLRGFPARVPGFKPVHAWLVRAPSRIAPAADAPGTAARRVELVFLSTAPQASHLPQAITQLIPEIDLAIQTAWPSLESDPPDLADLVAAGSILPAEVRFRRLSATEIVIATWLRTPATERQIAQALKRSPHTVHAHVRSIYSKLQINARPELRELYQQLQTPIPDPLPTLDHAS
ncbi:MAG: helix-turn-helix transcriptional regulator [Planctomycetota bacterium]